MTDKHKKSILSAILFFGYRDKNIIIKDIVTDDNIIYGSNRIVICTKEYSWLNSLASHLIIPTYAIYGRYIKWKLK